MEKQQIIEVYDNLRRAFAMMALAMVSDKPREKLKELMPNTMRLVPIPVDVRDKLRLRVARGDVTTIVADPEPFMWIVIKTAHEELRSIYGIWVGRTASWRGKVDPDKLPHIGAMTPQEAEAKGIPIPNLSKE